jgi:hypothetical protein
MKVKKTDLTIDTIVIIEPIPVMYVSGKKGAPVPEQAPEAFAQLEAGLSSLKGKKFYGAIIGDEYRACVGIDAHSEQSLPYPKWTIPGGGYVRRKIPNWEVNLHLIGPIFEDLCQRPDVDFSRPFIEYYRSRKELFLMVPVK